MCVLLAYLSLSVQAKKLPSKYADQAEEDCRMTLEDLGSQGASQQAIGGHGSPRGVGLHCATGIKLERFRQLAHAQRWRQLLHVQSICW